MVKKVIASQTNSAIDFCLPSMFDPEPLLYRKGLLPFSDDARYFISLILTKTAYGDADEAGFVRLKASFLRRIMHRHYYRPVIGCLLEAGVVERRAYRAGVASFGWRLSDRLRGSGHIRVRAWDRRLINAINRWHQECALIAESRLAPIHYELDARQRQLQIDLKQAQGIITSLPPDSNRFDSQGIIARNISEKRFRLVVGGTGRVFNSISNMKSSVRRSLRFEGQPLVHIDLKNSQPALLGYLVRDREVFAKLAANYFGGWDEYGERDEEHWGREAEGKGRYDVQFVSPSTADVSHFCSLVGSGCFYEYLQERVQLVTGKVCSRDWIKKRFLSDVLAKAKLNSSGREYDSIVEDAFKMEFPGVYRFIREVNAGGWQHANLIRMLQRLEAQVVIHEIASELVHEQPGMPFITLHDAIFTTPQWLPIALGLCSRSLSRQSIQVGLKVCQD